MLFAAGNNGPVTASYKRVDILNTLTNTWSIDSLTTARTFTAATSVGNKFMIGGGLTTLNGAPLNSIEIYTVTSTGLHQEINNISAFTLMPNPAHNNVTISLHTIPDNGIVELYNLLGEKVF